MELTSRLALYLLMSLPCGNFTLFLTDIERFSKSQGEPILPNTVYHLFLTSYRLHKEYKENHFPLV